MRVLVLGIGSPFGNDSLGWQVVDGLTADGLQQILAPHEVRLEKLDRPGVLLLERMRGFDCAILIDALLGGGEPGRVYRLGIEDVARGELRLSGHDLGVAEALALGKALGDLPPRVEILGIEAGGAVDLATTSEMLKEIERQISEIITTISVPQPVRC